MLKEFLEDILRVDDVLIIVRTEGAILEMRSNSLGIRQKDKWITIGENDGPCHMHVDATNIVEAQFLEEKKPDRTSFSVRFFDEKGEKQFSAVFAKMYDENKNLRQERKKLYEELFSKYGSKKTIQFSPKISN